MANSLVTAVSRRNLEAIWHFEKRRLLKSTFGVDRQTGKDFREHLPSELDRIRERALNGHKPSGLLAIAKPKPSGGNRIICVPTISDRVLQFALLSEFREGLERRGLLNPVSYGLIRGAGRGVNEARRRAVALRTSHKWVLKADIQKFFDNISRDGVRDVIQRVVPKRSLHSCLLAFIDSEIVDGFDPDWRAIVEKAGIVVGKGVRQGMPLSPYFAGMILRDLDRAILRRGYRAIRYVDDIVGFFDSEKECRSFQRFLASQLGKIGLSIGSGGESASKTKLYEPGEAAEFLGMEICWRVGSGYQLRIPKSCIEKIGAKFASAGTIDQLLSKRVLLPKLGTYLESIEMGYLRAYDGAENHDEHRKELASMKRCALNAVLEEALGPDVYKLSSKSKRFLGIDKL
jgi:retron-type reverse transcriptase